MHNIGADGIEIYTGSFAAAFRTESPDTLRQASAATDTRAADVAGYSRLMGADEDGTLERLKALRRELVDGRHRGAE